MKSSVSNRLLILARWFWILAPVVLVGWLVAHDMVLSGRFTIPVWGDGSSGYVRGPVPENRVSGPSREAGRANIFQMLDEPVYFDVQQSRPFRKATVQVSLDPGSADVIELGITTRTNPEMITLQPAYHRALEELAKNPEWQIVRSGGISLYQRGKTFSSVEQFLALPPESQRVAAYRASLDLPFTPTVLPPGGPKDGTDFILTGYQLLNAATLWLDVTASFALTADQMTADQLRFLVSVNPGQPFPAPWAPRLGSGVINFEGPPINFAVLRGWALRWFRPS